MSWSLLLSVCLWPEFSCVSVFSVSVTIVVTCWHIPLFICECISNILRSENHLFLIILLTWSENTLFVVLNLGNSTQISKIPFLYPLCVELLLKYQESARRLSSLVHFLRWSLIWVIASFVVCVSDKRAASIRKAPNGYLMLAIKEALAAFWVPRWVMFRFVLFNG